MLQGRVLGLACCLVAAVACGSRTTAGGEGEGEGSGDDGTTGGGTDGNTGDDGDDGTTGGGDDGTSGDDGGSTTGDTGGTEDGCPAREEVQAWLSVDLPMEEPFSGECVVESVNEAGTETTLTLSCEGPPPTPIAMTITADPPVALAHLEGLNVGLTYAVNVPWWLEQWLVLQTFDPPLTRLLVADGPTLEPPGGDLDHPGIALAEHDAVCPLVPGDCATEERLAIDVTSAGESRRLFDGSTAAVGVHEVWIPQARVNHPPINCSDLPSRWITVVAVDGG